MIATSAVFWVWMGFAALAAAQDNNFATHQYGSRSSLYGGAVVGGVRDTSACFYNPGGLAFVENENLSVNGSVYRISRLLVDDGAGTGDRVRSTPVEQFPGILSGVVLFDSLPGHAFGYSIVTRHTFDISATAREDEIRDVIDDAIEPGAEDFIGQLSVKSNLNELWGGLTWAAKVSPSIGIGATTFLALRTQDIAFDATARAVGNPSAQIHSSNFHIDSDYLNVRLLWRLGVTFGAEATRFGIALTTPSVNLYGRGTVFGDITIQDLDVDGNGTPDSFTANDRQSHLEADFHSPFSVSAGFEQRIDLWTFALSLDYYIEQGPFKVMQPKPSTFIRPTGVSTIEAVTRVLRVTYGTERVLNGAVAVDYAFTPATRGVLSIRTDYSAHMPDEDGEGLQLGISSWDLFHVTAGVILLDQTQDKTPKEELSIGLVYSFGRSDTKQVTNFATAAESNLLFGVPRRVDVRYDALGLLVGYTRYF